MDHTGTIALETSRLLLRRFTEPDAEAAYANWTSDQQVTEFLRWPVHDSVEVTRTVLDEWIRCYRQNDFYQWAIVLKEADLGPIGTISVVDQDERLDSVHIGYCIGSSWWHQGITSEAFGRIIPFLFDEVAVDRIESQHDPDNQDSGKVMVRCGLTYEGTLRQADFSNRGIVDAAVYSLLSREYRAGRG
jgi:[ribosomal protein S5]-alanine N-acetyltransferase